MPRTTLPTSPKFASATLDKRAAERDHLMRAYRRAKRTELAELCTDPIHGAALKKFIATLNHFGIEHADRFVDYVDHEARKWLAAASENIRFAALEACSERIQKIRMQNGLPPFDDPSERPNVFILCKKALRL